MSVNSAPGVAISVFQMLYLHRLGLPKSSTVLHPDSHIRDTIACSFSAFLVSPALGLHVSVDLQMVLHPSLTCLIFNQDILFCYPALALYFCKPSLVSRHGYFLCWPITFRGSFQYPHPCRKSCWERVHFSQSLDGDGLPLQCFSFTSMGGFSSPTGRKNLIV
jgi:hypothetical protein